MGILSDFFIADGKQAPDYSGGQGFAPDEHCQYQRITPLEAGRFLATLRGEECREATGQSLKMDEGVAINATRLADTGRAKLITRSVMATVQIALPS